MFLNETNDTSREPLNNKRIGYHKKKKQQTDLILKIGVGTFCLLNQHKEWPLRSFKFREEN